MALVHRRLWAARGSTFSALGSLPRHADIGLMSYFAWHTRPPGTAGGSYCPSLLKFICM